MRGSKLDRIITKATWVMFVIVVVMYSFIGWSFADPLWPFHVPSKHSVKR